MSSRGETASSTGASVQEHHAGSPATTHRTRSRRGAGIITIAALSVAPSSSYSPSSAAPFDSSPRRRAGAAAAAAAFFVLPVSVAHAVAAAAAVEVAYLACTADQSASNVDEDSAKPTTAVAKPMSGAKAASLSPVDAQIGLPASVRIQSPTLMKRRRRGSHRGAGAQGAGSRKAPPPRCFLWIAELDENAGSGVKVGLHSLLPRIDRPYL